MNLQTQQAYKAIGGTKYNGTLLYGVTAVNTLTKELWFVPVIPPSS